MNRKRAVSARVSALLAILGASLLVVTAASGRQSALVFSDPVGDAGAGPDIKAVSVQDAGGIVTFNVVVSGMKVVDGTGVKGTFFYIDVDTNKDGKRDYSWVVGADSEGFSWEVTDGAGKEVPQSGRMSYIRSGDSHSLRIGSADLGGATSFDFYATAGTLPDSGDPTFSDDAPDGGAWSYNVTSVKPVLGMPTTSPLAPVAGKPFTLTLPVTRSDTGSKLGIGTMTSDLRVGAQSLAHTQSFKNGTAAVHISVPVGAKGKVLTVRVAIVANGQSVTRLASFHVA